MAIYTHEEQDGNLIDNTSKKEKIGKIKEIIEDFGSFSIKEVEDADEICVNEMGKLVALAEDFNLLTVGISVYDPTSFSSDAIDDYKEPYENLDEDTLDSILFLCEQYEAEQLQTEKRISN